MNSPLVAACIVLCFAEAACSQVPEKSPRVQQTYPQPVTDVAEGFESIFDGNSLAGWEGDPKYWRVEDGVIVGEVTPDTLLERNSFLIWRGGEVRDFELVVDYRVSARGNSGINYRSEFTPHGDAPWAMKGYQFDIDGQNHYTGQNYEERGRTFLARRGQAVRASPDAAREIIGSVGDADELATFVNQDDWNTVHVIARGAVLTHLLNGHVMSIVVDNDAQHRKLEGLLGVQVHVGPPMKIEYRNVRLKHLEPVAE